MLRISERDSVGECDPLRSLIRHERNRSPGTLDDAHRTAKESDSTPISVAHAVDDSTGRRRPDITLRDEVVSAGRVQDWLGRFDKLRLEDRVNRFTSRAYSEPL